MVKAATENSCQTYTVFTNDQELFNITTQIICWQPNVWENVYPVLWGMHLLMTFAGCMGSLMNTRDYQIFLNPLVDKMLLGKYFPNNIRALCMFLEEILRPVLLYYVLPSFEVPGSPCFQKPYSQTVVRWTCLGNIHPMKIHKIELLRRLAIPNSFI